MVAPWPASSPPRGVLLPSFPTPPDVGITIQVANSDIPSADYEDGPAEELDKLDPHVISTWTTRKRNPIHSQLGLL
jgi:hypothetical protein